MDEPWGHYANKISQSQKVIDCMIPLIRGIQMVRFLETESRMMVTSGWRREEWGRCWLKGAKCMVITIISNVLYTLNLLREIEVLTTYKE